MHEDGKVIKCYYLRVCDTLPDWKERNGLIDENSLKLEESAAIVVLVTV